MEIACMENQTNVSDVLKREVESERENLKSSAQLDGVLHIYSGNGDASYSENFTRQRYVFHVLQPLFQAAIKKLTFPKEGPLIIADLGCATGLNTISDVDFVVKTLTNLCDGLAPRFQAFLSDLPCNDFNEMFNLLDGINRSCFVAGVPGFFYNVLFPNSSIHVCFSIMALHWISEVPQGVLNKDSPLYNKGKVWINRGRQDIVDLYSKQSQKDLTTFMRCKADEMAEGGVLFLCLLGGPDSLHPTQQISVGGELCGQDFEDAWDDFMTEGIIILDLRD